MVQVTIRHSSQSSRQRDVCILYNHPGNNRASSYLPETMILGRCNTGRTLRAGRLSWWTHPQWKIVSQRPGDLLRGE